MWEMREKPHVQGCHFLPRVIKASSEMGLLGVFLHSVLVQAYIQHEFYHSRWNVLIKVFATNSSVFHMSVMHTKLRFKMFCSDLVDDMAFLIFLFLLYVG